MVIVGELINSTRRDVAGAIARRDGAFLKDLARRQAEAGADIIDVNVAVADGDEVENLKWLVNLLQGAVDIPLCLDSPNPAALKAGLSLCGQRAMINSITAESHRWDEILPLIQQYKPRVLALCMDDGGVPETVEDRLRIAAKLVDGLVGAGVSGDDVFIDPLVKPICINTGYGMTALKATRAVKVAFPGVKTICGLSNISYGLPGRRLLNRAFMVMCVAAGMDAFILDPLDRPTMSLLDASLALAGRDEYCMNYIAAARAGKIEF